VSYYGYDGHGSTRFLTSTNGAVTDTCTYDAYGTVIAQTGNSTPNNYLYAGQQFDPDIGLYYNRARYFNQNTGRFWTMDTFEGDNEDPLSLHKYLYGGDNPVDNDDPSGNDFEALAVMDISGMLDSIGLPVASQAKNLALQATGKYVDVYVWDGQSGAPFFGSVGHVMSTEHNSTGVVLSQFPFKKKTGGAEGTYRAGMGYNRTISYADTFKEEAPRKPSHRYMVLVPTPSEFYKVAGQQRAATYWNWDPTSSDETQCSTAVWLSLEAGKVAFEKGQVYKANGGTLMPSTVDGWLLEDSKAPTTTGVKSVDPTSGQ
jgi:RHS repeat-associated protein